MRKTPLNEVPMLPGDYKALAPTVMQKSSRWTIARLYELRPVGRTPLAWPTGISLTIWPAGTHRLSAPLLHHQNSEDKREQASSIFPCIAYVNYVDGRPVNAKYRSCSPIQSPSPKRDSP